MSYINENILIIGLVAMLILIVLLTLFYYCCVRQKKENQLEQVLMKDEENAIRPSSEVTVKV